MAREFLSFDNWTLGDTGRHGPMAYHYGRRKMLASYGHFRGMNVIRYPNGAVGPRPALKYRSDLGATITGQVIFVEYAAGIDMLYVVTNAGYVYRRNSFLVGGGSWSVTVTGLSPICAAVYGNDLYIGAPGGVYRVTSGGVQTGPFANSPANCSFLVEYREVLVGAGNASGSVAYSAPGDGTTWPASNTLGIGAANITIVGLFAQRNSLVTALANGEWWTTTGFLTQGGTVGNDVTRRADLGPVYAGFGCSVMQSTIWYVNGRDACNFTGAQTSMEPIPDADGLPGAYFPTLNEPGAPLTCTSIEPALTQPDSFLVVGTGTVNAAQVNYGFLRQGTTGWTRHTLPVAAPNLSLPKAKGVFSGDVFLVSQNGTQLRMYQWLPRLETPYGYNNGDPLVNNLDGDTAAVVGGSFSLPEWWVPDGGSAHVHGVVVDFEYDQNAITDTIANGNSADSVVHFDINVEALNLYEADLSRTSNTQSFTPKADALARAAAGVNQPVRRRELFRVGDQGIGSGFRVNLTNMRGVMVYRIVVVVDLEDEKAF